MNTITISGKPVFIVGMNGSGTTMMLNCLNAHQELYGFPRETLVIPHYVRTLSDYGDLNNARNFEALWNSFRSVSCFSSVNGGAPPELPKNWQDYPHTLSSVIDATFTYFAQNQGKRRWCEKTPMHAQHIVALHGLFPQAYFIHMIRDGRSCAASFHRRWSYIPQRTIYRWKNVIIAARQQAEESGARYLEVFYESLTSDPDTEMRKVCEFLDVPFDNAVLSPSRKPKHSGSSAETIVSTTPRWKTHFSKHTVRALESIAGRTLSDLGYKVDVSSGDTDPSLTAILFWAMRDHLRGMARLAWQQVKTPKDEQWENLSSRVKRAIQQRLSSRF